MFMRRAFVSLVALTLFAPVALAKEKGSTISGKTSGSGSSAGTGTSASTSANSTSRMNLAPVRNNAPAGQNFKPAQPPSAFQQRTFDNGNTVNKQIQVDVNKKNNVFIYGGSNTIYPAGDRKPGQEVYNPRNPQQSPQTNYGVGVGIRY